MGRSLKIAALVGVFAGMVVGIAEAALAARGGHRLPTVTVPWLWLITVGIYAIMGWAAFGVLGLVIGALPPISRRLIVTFSALGAAVVPAAILLGHPSTDPFRPVWALAAAAAAGGLTWLVVARLAGRTEHRADLLGSHRRHAWWLLLWPVPFAAVVAILGVRIAYPSTRAGTPNVLIITLDALRADRLGCDGSPLGLTPNLDRLAKDAVVFRSAFSSAPWTEASLGSTFTSLFPSELGLVRGSRVEEEVRFEGGVFTPQPTLAELLRDAGYLTVAELVNPQIRRDRGFSRGFVQFRNPDDLVLPGTILLPRLGRYEQWFASTSLGRVASALAGPEPRHKALPGVDKDDAERLVGDAEDRLASSGGRPVFMWMHLMDTHVPYRSHAVSSATRVAFPHPAFAITDRFCKDLVWKRVQISAEGKRYLEAVYNDQVRHADAWIGRFLQYLKDRRLYDNTLIIISADHGEEFWDHGGFEHGRTMYDEVLRVPLLVKFPGSKYGGTQVAQLVRSIDVLPTVVQIAGVPVPRGIRGHTLTELLTGGGSASKARELYAESTLYGEEQKALRTAEHKLIFHIESRKMEVYELRSDPGEHRDLASDQAVAGALREQLLRLARESEQRGAWWAKYGEKAPPLDQESLERLRSIGYMAK